MNINDDQMLLSPKTKAFICLKCGAVSLDNNKICEVQGIGTKADWCGIKHAETFDQCFSRQKYERFRCKSCKQVSIDPQLLCKPEKI